MASPPHATLAGQYDLLREIGRGGMATVYLGFDRKHDRKVAIKVLDPELAAAIGPELFQREITLTARLTHPHILPLHDSGSADGRLYYVMPFVEQGSLRGRLEREGRLPIDEAVRHAREVASALQTAHRLGFLHCDIKPENILLVADSAVLADFGIARLTGASRALADLAGSGTSLYMSPEQARDDPGLDGRADLYSLSCVLYELLTGEPPFPGAEPETIKARHAFEAPPPLAAQRPGVPAAVERAVMRALAKDRDQRHGSALLFAEALSLHLQEPAPVVARGAGNLPAERTRMIGRQRVLEDATALLAGTRLLTLTGVGGCGKTRLALRLGAGAVEQHPFGVWFVDLAPITDPTHVPRAVADVWGLAEEADCGIVELLASRLAGRRALLILDNCEHVIEACAALVDPLLRAAGELRVLATSREPLGLEGEQVYAVPPLAAPAPGEHDAGAIAANEAVSLFVDRARAVRPDFGLDAGNAGAVAEVCRGLDGLPLAIELAAARVSVLSPAQIRARLADRFHLLTGARDTTGARHQTMLAVVRWSYDHLEEEERRLLRHLAVFRGGGALDQAIEVASRDEFAVLDGLTRLIAKSLVIADAGADGVRYRLLETVRQFAADRLEEEGEGDGARERHLHAYGALGARAAPALNGPAQGEWIARLDRELENIVTAIEWTIQTPKWSGDGLRLADRLRVYWHLRGRYRLGLRLIDELLPRGREALSPAELAPVLFGVGDLDLWTGDHAGARARIGEALAIYRELGDRRGIARALNSLGVIHTREGDEDRARERLLESLEHYRAIGFVRGISIAHTNLGISAMNQGDAASAEQWFRRALEMAIEQGEPDGIAGITVNLGVVAMRDGRLDLAAARFAEGFEVMQGYNLVRLAPDTLEAASALAARLGDGERCTRIAGAAAKARDDLGLVPAMEDRRSHEEVLARGRELLGDVRFGVALAAGRALALDAAIEETLTWLRTRAPADAAS